MKLRPGDRVLVFLNKEHTRDMLKIVTPKKTLVPATVRKVEKRRVSLYVPALLHFVGAKRVVSVSRASEGSRWCRGWEGSKANVLKTVHALSEART